MIAILGLVPCWIN